MKKGEDKTKNKTSGTIILVIIILLISGTLLISKYYSSKGLIIKEYPIKTSLLSSSYNGLKIVQFSDIHYNSSTNKSDLEKIVKRILDLKPDILIYNGDLFNDEVDLSKNDYEDIIKTLDPLKEILYKYYIMGNHDYKDENKYKEIMESCGFKFLKNEMDLLYINDIKPIMIIGFDSLLKGKIDTSILDNEEYHDYYKIAILHEPDIIKELKNYNINIALAGHSHNGQIRIPFVGAIYNVEGAKTYFDEYYQVGNIDLYVSSGIGTSVIPFRLFNKPSINFYRFFVK